MAKQLPSHDDYDELVQSVSDQYYHCEDEFRNKKFTNWRDFMKVLQTQMKLSEVSEYIYLISKSTSYCR